MPRELKILSTPNKLLRKLSHPVTVFDEELGKLIADLEFTLLLSEGVGLAAPQVGVLKQIFLVKYDPSNFPLTVFINPQIEFVQTGTKTYGIEACLSIPGLSGIVARDKQIKVTAQNVNGETFTLDTEEDTVVSRIIQHEMDHLKGRLFTDWAREIFKMKPSLVEA